MAPLWIYHLTTPSELRRGLRGDRYAPDHLDAEGYVHCAPRGAVMDVARAFFGSVREPVLVLEIDPGRLRAELRYEPPAHPRPPQGAFPSATPRFPHVYGPIDRDAIAAVGRLVRHEDGFAWPAHMQTLDEALG